MPKKIFLCTYRSKFWQKPKKEAVNTYHIMTGFLRILPDFLIIGAQRCGTTSLFRYITQNPYVLPSRRKEVHFYDYQFQKGINWYKAHFPTIFQKITLKNKVVTGEATPSYIHHPHTPGRVFETDSKMKLIVLLRNPVDRAYSNYLIACRNGVEKLSFSEAIRNEECWIEYEYKKVFDNQGYYSYDFHRRSYLNRGIYIYQLKNWMKYFPQNQFLIIKSEDFYLKPKNIVNMVFEFLNVPFCEIDISQKYNQAVVGAMNSGDRLWLNNYFKKYNQMLYEYLGKEFGWGC